MQSITMIYVMATIATLVVLVVPILIGRAVVWCLADRDGAMSDSSSESDIKIPPGRTSAEYLSKADIRSLQMTFTPGPGGKQYEITVDISPIELSFHDAGSVTARLSNRWDAGWSDKITRLTRSWLESHQILYRDQDVYAVARERFVVYDDQDLDYLIYCGRAVRVKTVVLSS